MTWTKTATFITIGMADASFTAQAAGEIYGASSMTVGTATASGQASPGSQAGMNGASPPGDMPSSQPWYEASWTTPAAYLIIVYCVTSACVLLLLLCNGYMDCRLNVNFSYAAANQRELRRRRRHSQRLNIWIERERRDAEQMEADSDEEVERATRLFEEQRHQRQRTPDASQSLIEQEAIQQRQESDARVLVGLQRAGLL